jgi:hypothetical protein
VVVVEYDDRAGPSSNSSGVNTLCAASNPRMGRLLALPIPSRRQREPVAMITQLAPNSSTSPAMRGSNAWMRDLYLYAPGVVDIALQVVAALAWQ